MERNKIELLAPAGSYEGFEAAIGAGADAVYVGGAAFGARAYARNFDTKELIRAIDTAHIHGKKLYLTVNTLLKNKELYQQLYDYLTPYYEAGLDAVIVQDLGVFSYIKEKFPGLHLHASTQMTITGPEGMKFLEQQGASRVVAARELSLTELSAMHRTSPIEIEAFVHGALCYSFSGQCLMSSILGGRSGNRGRCAQPCRLPYQAALENRPYKGKKELCPLSLKDINTIEILPQILKAGVTSLKIEGRMKQPAYTAGVTAMYRKYLDILFEQGEENYKVEEADKRYLINLFNRGGSCGGYYQQQNGPSMMAFTNEKKTGDVIPEIRKRTEKINGNLILFPGSPVILEVSCRGVKAAASAGEVQFAKNQPMEEARIRQQMNKLGNTPFEWEKLDIEMDERIFLPVKVLNEVRRDALEALEQAILEKSRRTLPQEKASGKPEAGKENASSALYKNTVPTGEETVPLYVSCERTDVARVLTEQAENVRGLYLPFDAMKSCLSKGLSRGMEMYLSLPHMVRGEMPGEYLAQIKEWLSQGMSGFLVRNLEVYGMLKEQGLGQRCVLDHSLYTWNDEAIRFWEREHILRNTAPLEINEKELRHRRNDSSEMLIYGYLPVMLSAQCVRKNLFGCSRQQEVLHIKDRYEKEFPVSCNCSPWKTENTKKTSPCYNIIYNSIPYGLLKEKAQADSLGMQAYRISFTIEDPGEAMSILKEFQAVYQEDGEPARREFTKGHFKRGAE